MQRRVVEERRVGVSQSIDLRVELFFDDRSLRTAKVPNA